MTADFDDVFGRLIAEVDKAAVGDLPRPPLAATAEGCDPDERVSVTMTDGQVTEVRLADHAVRLPRTDLEQAIRDAVNAALVAQTAAMVEAMGEPGTDFAALSSSLRSIQAETIQTMNRYTDSMLEMLRTVKKP